MSKSIPNYVLNYFHQLLGRHQERLKVDYALCARGSDEISFSSFHRFGGEAGNGAIALQEVCDLADDYQIKLTLWTEFPKLIPYYERFGFKSTAKTGRNWNFARKPGPQHLLRSDHLNVPARWHDSLARMQGRQPSIAELLGLG